MVTVFEFVGVCCVVCVVEDGLHLGFRFLVCGYVLLTYEVGAVGVVRFCLNCDSCGLKCSVSGSVCVSSRRCCMLVSPMHPVAVLHTAFCMTCSFCMFVSESRGDHEVEAYSRRGLMTAL